MKNKGKEKYRMMLRNMKFYIKETKKCQILLITLKEIVKQSIFCILGTNWNYELGINDCGNFRTYKQKTINVGSTSY